jgi:hypothetical protein
MPLVGRAAYRITYDDGAVADINGVKHRRDYPNVRLRK